MMKVGKLVRIVIVVGSAFFQGSPQYETDDGCKRSKRQSFRDRFWNRAEIRLPITSTARSLPNAARAIALFR